MGISFSEPERLKEIFDSEHREEWQKTSHIIQSIGIKKDTIIADVGAGTGYFSNIFYQYIKTGKIYSIDSEPNMVTYMKDRFSSDQFERLNVIQSTPDNPCIPSDVDIVFIANAYRFIEDRENFLHKMKSQINAKTICVIVDLKGERARVTSDMTIDEISKAGFKIENVDFQGCPDHFILTFMQATENTLFIT